MVQSEGVVVNPAKGVAAGDYRLVGWGVDTTGRRLIDEICQIAAYSPAGQFSQYIMPFADLNPIFSRKHGVRVVNTVRYRRLKCLKTNQYVKTKSEISALTDFLGWLEEARGDAAGVVLVCHEVRKAAPGMLLEALRRYGLVERFARVAKGFANGFDVARAKCANTTKSFSLKVMAKVLLNREEEAFGNAVERAKAAYDVAAHLAQGERVEVGAEAGGGGDDAADVVAFVCPFVNPIAAEEEEIAGFKVLLEIQNTYRPVFGALLRASKTERQKASHLRRLLAENNISYDKSKEAYEKDAKDGLEKLIKNEIANAKDDELDELLEILDCHFDPEKKPVLPKARPGYNNNNNRGPRRKSLSNAKTSTSESHSPNASSAEASAEADSAEASPRDPEAPAEPALEVQ